MINIGTLFRHQAFYQGLGKELLRYQSVILAKTANNLIMALSGPPYRFDSLDRMINTTDTTSFIRPDIKGCYRLILMLKNYLYLTEHLAGRIDIIDTTLTIAEIRHFLCKIELEGVASRHAILLRIDLVDEADTFSFAYRKR
ncbi:hypothetical protein O9992_03075 [Vibrio lentus]|nr:hypothetical protein [Vibrio lentus]